MMKFLLTMMSAVLLATTVIAQNNPKGLATGQTAPGFSAKDQYGKKIDLRSVLKKGPVVLIFYRGQWCPYCNKQLSQLQDSISFITAKGATLLAITPEVTENIAKTIDKTKASYSILHDEKLKIMKQYDVAYKLDNAIASKFKNNGIDLNKANGSNGTNLPVPAVYIIGTNGKITYRFFDVDYKMRASVQEILEHL